LNKFYCILLTFFLPLCPKAQSPILDKFDVQANHQHVFISCTIASGNICHGIEIWRSLDSVNFVLIGDIPGLCGSLAEPVNYSFTDENPPKNQSIFYQLKFGGFGESEILKTRINHYGVNSYLVFPQPAQQYATILFDYEFSFNYKFKLFNHIGQEVLEVYPSEYPFKIPIDIFTNGIYSFVISQDYNTNIIVGKLLIQN
jgi:hypothetical protein